MADLDRLLAARSVAVVGASGRSGSFGERLAIEALRSPGVERVHLVNPAYAEVQGRTTVPTLSEISDPIDLVLMGVPDRTLSEHLTSARDLGVGGAVVYGSAVGQAASIREAAGNLPVCGAGCMGFVNVSHGLRALGYLERDRLVAGGIALITHSGSMFSALLRSHRRLEFSIAVSSGQELVTTTGEYLAWILDQPETRVVGLFLETIRNGPLLRAGLARAADLGIPVVALTVGSSVTGRAMVTAHSGAIAGDDAAWEALFETYGVHRCRDVEEFVDTLELFSIGRRLVTGARAVADSPRGIATVHDSGAQRVLMADLASEEGVPFAELSDATAAAIAEQLDEGLLVSNPLDVWGRGADTETLFGGCLDALAAEPNVDVVALAIDLVEEYDGDESYPRAVASTAAKTDKPVVVISHVSASIDQVQASRLREAGIPVLEGARSGLRALAHLRAHQPAEPSLAQPKSRRVATELTGRRLPGWLGAVESLALLAEYGIEVVPTIGATNLDGVLAAASEVGYPVVLKTDERGIEHRVSVGGVHLGVPDQAALRVAYADLARRCGPTVVVQPQLTADADSPEIALGILSDQTVGHIVLAAVGGSDIEHLRQRVLALTPLDDAGATALAQRWHLLTGSEPPTGLVNALLGLSDLVSDLGDQVSALDINPLLVLGDRLVAVDALIQAS